MKKLMLILLMLMVIAPGCYKPKDQRISLQEGIRSDSLDNNIVTRPVQHAFSALIGEGLEITEAVTRRNDAGFLELYVSGVNNSYNTKRFRYRVEWIDADGLLVGSKATTWHMTSAMGKSPFTFKDVAPRANAVNFRMNTRKWE